MEDNIFCLKDYILNNSCNNNDNNNINNSDNNSDNSDSCSSCNNKNIVNYCLNDNDLLCVACTNQHSKTHNIITYREYKESTLYLNYHEFTESYSNINQYNIDMDRKNKLLNYDINNNKIEFGSKWSNCGIDSNQDPFLVVSFTGYSGSGKSSIICSLSSDNNHPIPGKESSTNSTSSDINSYIGQITKESENYKYIILDSEGLGGSIPIYMEDKFKILNNNSQESKKLKKEIKLKRSNVVQLLYPKLLTIISDVIVFTFKGSPKEKSNIFKQIKKLNYISSSTSNIQVKPHLIILLNKQTTPEILDDIEYATQDYFSGLEEEDLHKFKMFYKSVSVIYIPNIKENNNNSFKRFQSQISQLKDLISIKLLESLKFKKSINFNLSKEKSMDKISNLVNEFNKNPNLNGSFDFSLFDISSDLSKSLNGLEDLKIPDQSFKRSKQNHQSISIDSSQIINQFNNNNSDNGLVENNEEDNSNQLNESVYYVSNVPVIGLHRNKNSHFIFTKSITSSISSLSSLPKSTLNQFNNLLISKSTHNSFCEEDNAVIVQDINSGTKIISNSLISNIIISNYLITYFKLCYYKLIESGITRRESFYLAKIKIKSKILPIFNKFKSRNYSNENNILEEALDIFSQDVDQLVPCKQIISNLECINLKNSHYYHQTKQQIDKDINFSEKRKRTIKIPYIEQGKFNPLYRYEDFKIYLNKEPIKTDLYYLDFKNCKEVCVCCFLEEPVTKLKCDHIVCNSCSLENGIICNVDQCHYNL